jgi:hypothetical protein
MALGFQLTKIPSNSGAAAAPRKVAGGVEASAAFDGPPVAGLDAEIACGVPDPELGSATGDVPAGWALVGEALSAWLGAAADDLLAGWALVGEVLRVRPLMLVSVPLPGAAVAVLVAPCSDTSKWY